jgi:photosystem I P700 chlorophyll a apoprotein A2
VYGSPKLSAGVLEKSLELELSASLILVSQSSAYAAHHIYSMSPYVYLSSDYVTSVALFSHHIWISAFSMLGAFVHGGIFICRDYRFGGQGDLFGRILSHKASIISHLSWVSLWLGFHTLLVYVHNDSVSAFGDSEKQLSISPLYAQLIQEFSGKKSYGIMGYYGSFSGLSSSFLPIFSPDLMAHHAISLGLHVTVLILIKGALDSRGSRLLPDKYTFGYSFPCDGPGRGGTCDITSWDSMYLATFWLLNSISWSLYYFHWKHLSIWQNNSSSFSEGGSALMAWFRDYLWFNSAPLIRGYSSFAANDLGVWSWIFLGAHLCWATGFMFLISWRGYWQELIESIV